MHPALESPVGRLVPVERCVGEGAKPAQCVPVNQSADCIERDLLSALFRWGGVLVREQSLPSGPRSISQWDCVSGACWAPCSGGAECW